MTGGKVTHVLRALVVRNVRTVLAIMARACASLVGAGRRANSVYASLHAASTAVAWMASAFVKMAGVARLALDTRASRHVRRTGAA